MASLLGMPGFAAADLFADWGLLCVGVFMTFTAAFFGLLLRSRVALLDPGFHDEPRGGRRIKVPRLRPTLVCGS